MKYLSLLSVILFFHIEVFSQQKAREFEIAEGDTNYIMKQYIMCFLRKGDHRDQSKEEREKIQAGHLDHINKLSEDGYVVLAGPFGDDGDLRGILVFDVESIEEARSLEEKDPAVKSGRLIMDFHPWWTAKGSVLK